MNVRKEDRRKHRCPGRGFGLAGAAIGVGVGATLFINQGPENPDCERSTTENWQCEQLHTFCERSWNLEACTICFEVMLRTQELMKLPCSHNFHSQCITPWLQERPTCPNCRKVA